VNRRRKRLKDPCLCDGCCKVDPDRRAIRRARADGFRRWLGAEARK
jgi:hypothetical protein